MPEKKHIFHFELTDEEKADLGESLSFIRGAQLNIETSGFSESLPHYVKYLSAFEDALQSMVEGG